MRQLTEHGFQEVAKQFRLLGDPGRLRVLDLLRKRGEMSVGEIADAVECSVANASRQLARLHDAQLLARRQEGQTVYYGIEAEWVFGLCELVCGRLEASGRARGAQPLFTKRNR